MILSKESYERLNKKQEEIKINGQRPITKATKLSNLRGEKKLKEFEEILIKRL